PPRETAIGVLARAVARLEEEPMPARLDGPTRAMLESLAPAMPLGQRVPMTNLWLFSPLVTRLLARTPATNASVRTTTAPTILEAGVKENVLASRARAVVNFRLLPGDSVVATTVHVREVIDDPRVKLTPVGGGGSDASAV